MRLLPKVWVVSLVVVLSAAVAGGGRVGHAQNQSDTDNGEDETERNGTADLPLAAGRTVSIATDEGSWLSLDVSPDGQMVVFDLLGDLYTVPFAGGAALPLTEGMAYDNQPRFSPDGASVLFVSDRDGAENLWTIAIESKKTDQITSGKTSSYESPEWLPDGDYVVASKATGTSGNSRIPKLWMWHVDGGSGIQLIKEPDNLRTSGAAPTPDGRHIWFAERTGLWQYNAIFPQYQLAIYDRQTGERYARSGRYGSAFRPTISPDGRWLVYGTRHESHTGLRLRELATGEERWLAYPVQRDDQESVASSDVLPGMSFTPDSTELVASYGGHIWRIPVGGGNPIQIPFEVNVDLEIGPELAFKYPVDRGRTFTVRQIRDAVPSPRLSPSAPDRLAFAALDRLYVTVVPDGSPVRLTDLEMTEAQPAWSPDGAWVVFVTWSPDGGDVYKVSAGGGAPIRLTTTRAVYQQPTWSPDGQRIVVIQGPARAYQEAAAQTARGANENIVWIGADGGETTIVAPTNGRSAPHFAGDSERIYLHHAREGLVSVRWDGTDEKEHVRVTGRTAAGAEEPERASLLLMAPNQSRALAQVGNHLYVVTVPTVGGETPTVSVADPERAVVPVRKLTDIGGQFPVWSADGRRAHWSIGNAHFVYDLDDADAATRVAAETADDEEENPDEVAAANGGEPGAEDYQPTEFAIAVEAVRDIPLGRVLLRGARVITMVGDQVIERADILVENGSIAEVGRQGSIDFPDATRIIELNGSTIVPGFVDTHAHLRPSFGVHKTQSWAYLANLAYGVTTTRDPQTGSTDVLAYSDMVEVGKMIGPRIYSTGPGVFSGEQIEDLEHARSVLKRYSTYYDTKTIKMYMAGNRQQRQWIIMAAKEQRLLPTTEGGLDLKYNLEMMIDGYPGQEHAFPVTPLYKDVVTLTAQSGMAYTPTLIVSYGGPFGENYFYTRENPHDDPKLRRFTPHDVLDMRTRRRGAGTGPGPGGWFMDEEHVFQSHAATVNAIVEAGGRVGVGSHGQLQGLGYHWELWMVHSGGMSEHDALRAATILGADAIGLDGDLGSIEAGKVADLVVLRRNPLEDIRYTKDIQRVMKNGRLYDADTLDELWPRERALGELTWHGQDPDGVTAGLR
jgi:Tol biopolymer transport system component